MNKEETKVMNKRSDFDMKAFINANEFLNTLIEKYFPESKFDLNYVYFAMYQTAVLHLTIKLDVMGFYSKDDVIFQRYSVEGMKDTERVRVAVKDMNSLIEFCLNREMELIRNFKKEQQIENDFEDEIDLDD